MMFAKNFQTCRQFESTQEEYLWKKTEVQCKQCKKIFSRADNLKRHQKVCGKRFFSKQVELEIKYIIIF